MSYRETLFASLEVKKPQVAAGRQAEIPGRCKLEKSQLWSSTPLRNGGPLGKLGQISKAPDSPIAGPASPHAGGLGLVPVEGGVASRSAVGAHQFY
jgi:hypothetical protein